MKILSLNVNNFGGINRKKDKKKYKGPWEWRKKNKDSFPINSKAIIEYIMDEKINPDVIVLSEVELDTVVYDNFKEDLTKMNYELIPYETPEYPKSSITMIFINKGEQGISENLEAEKNPHKRHLRASIIKVNDYIIYGVHCPEDTDFWDELLGYYEKNKDEKLLIIGDLNVIRVDGEITIPHGIDKKEKAKWEIRKKFQELLKKGAKDIWIERKNLNETETYNSGKRIDYAIATPSLYPKIRNIEIDHTLRESKVTDHSAVIVEIRSMKVAHKNNGHFLLLNFSY